ncbi:MAG: type II toxin-antitoxin system HigB family toxin [Phycisphaerae bacterium]
MNVISRKKLRAFYEATGERRQHAAAFDGWFKLTRKARWQSFQDTKALFGQTDVARDTASKRTATIFDLGGNKFRIITLIDYLRQTVLITHVLSHKEYDKNKWKNDI